MDGELHCTRNRLARGPLRKRLDERVEGETKTREEQEQLRLPRPEDQVTEINRLPDTMRRQSKSVYRDSHHRSKLS